LKLVPFKIVIRPYPPTTLSNSRIWSLIGWLHCPQT
jgi:hypothetical protein